MAESLFPLGDYVPDAPELVIVCTDSAGVKLTKRRAHMMAVGQHPMGGRLRDPAGESCGSCAHATARNERSESTFWKCGLMRKAWTSGPGTDIRLKWPACERWEAKP